MKQKQKISLYAIFGKIGDILFYPVLLLALLSCFFIVVNKKENKPTSFFGFSLVNILSESMLADGFERFETVLIRKVEQKNIRLGDIIAFYYDSTTPSVSKVNLVCKYNYSSGTYVNMSNDNITYEMDINSINIKTDSTYIEKSAKKGSKIDFHIVIGIYVDDNGSMFYKTKGSSNGSADINLCRGDLVVGEYVHTPKFIRQTIKFASSMQGMLMLVCLPLSILVFLQLVSIIEQVSVIIMENQLVKRKKYFKDKDVYNEFNGNILETHNKALLFLIAKKEDKQDIKYFLWSDILNKEKLSNSEQKLKDTIEKSEKLLKSPSKYWNVWISYGNKQQKKKFEEFKRNRISLK